MKVLTKALTISLLILVLAAFTLPANAISPIVLMGQVSGTVKTKNGDAVGGCTVTFTKSGSSTSTTTDSSGNYLINLSIGTYEIVASRPDVGTSPSYSVEVEPYNPSRPTRKNLEILSLPSTISMSFSKSSVVGDDNDYLAVTVQVKDVFGKTPGVSTLYTVEVAVDDSSYNSSIHGSVSKTTSKSGQIRVTNIPISTSKTYYGWAIRPYNVGPLALGISAKFYTESNPSNVIDSAYEQIQVTAAPEATPTPTPSPSPVTSPTASPSASPVASPAASPSPGAASPSLTITPSVDVTPSVQPSQPADVTPTPGATTSPTPAPTPATPFLAALGIIALMGFLLLRKEK